MNQRSKTSVDHVESPLKHPWKTLETPLEHPWNTPKGSLEHPWNTYETPLKHFWNILETVLKHRKTDTLELLIAAKKFWVENYNWVEKMLWVEKLFRVEKMFYVENFFASNKILSRKIFRVEIFLIHIALGIWKYLLVMLISMKKTFSGQLAGQNWS